MRHIHCLLITKLRDISHAHQCSPIWGSVRINQALRGSVQTAQLGLLDRQTGKTYMTNLATARYIIGTYSSTYKR